MQKSSKKTSEFDLSATTIILKNI